MPNRKLFFASIYSLRPQNLWSSWNDCCAQPAHDKMAKMIGRQRWDGLILTVFLAPYFVHLGTSALWDANEAFYVEGPREMLESGDLLSPRFNFSFKLNKPILPYWVVLPAFKLFGVSEWSERLVIAICMVATVLLTYALGRRLYGHRVGLLGAIVLASTAKFLMVGRRSLIDALLTTLLVAALCLLVRGGAERKLFVGAYVMMGLAVLTKGLVGIVIPLGIVLTFLLWQGMRRAHPRSSRRLVLSVILRQGLRGMNALRLPLGLLIVLAVATPWYAAMIHRHGWGFLSAFIVGDHVKRFLYGTSGMSRPWWYYGPVLLSEFFPWSFFLPAAVVATILRLRSLGGTSSATGAPTDLFSSSAICRSLPANNAPGPASGDRGSLPSEWADRFLLAWMGFILIFFSLSVSKQNEYLLPLYPAAALVVGRFFSEAQPFSSRFIKGLFAFSIALLAGAFIGGAWIAASRAPTLFDSHRLLTTTSVILLIGALLLVGAYLFGTLGQVFALTAVTMLVFTGVSLSLLPKLENYRPVRPLAERIAREAAPDDLVGYYRFTAPSLCYYSRRKIFEVFAPAEIKAILRSTRRAFCLMYERDIIALGEDPALPLRVVECRPSLFPMTMKRFLRLRGPGDLERICLVTNR